MSSSAYPLSVRRLIQELTKLPTIGEKSAARLAYHLVMREEKQAFDLADAIRRARESIGWCQECFSWSENGVCQICTSPQRSRTVICVVEKPADVIAVERSGGFRGLYHVLHGLWSPLRGISPEKTKIGDLVQRIHRRREEGDPVDEVVLATGSTVEGDATALYIANLLNEAGVRVSRIAQGIPMGGELEYADELTVNHAFEGRRRL